MKIGIIVAMEKELRELRRLFPDQSHVQVAQCGIGKVNAALGAAEMISQWHPDVLISSGCAGGNGPGVGVRDVVVATETAYHDVYCGDAAGQTVYGQVQGMPARYAADPRLLELSRSIDLSGLPLPEGETRQPRVHHGLTVTGDWFVDSREKMQHIVSLFPEARAVDMESAAIAQTCYRLGVPFLSLRIVSDVPLSDDHASQYHDFWNGIARQSFHVTRSFVESL